MTDSAKHALDNVIQEYRASSQALNIRERIDLLGRLVCFAHDERLGEQMLLDDIEWAGTAPMGGQ